MAVSLREVADRAGLSRATVSRILNNRGAETRISVSTQERVRNIAAEIGYKPNRFAQGLSTGRTNIVGVMIPGLHNPFFLNLLESTEIAALQLGFDVMADTAFQMRSLYKAQGKLSGWPVDGVLAWLPPHESLSHYVEGASSELPTVYLGYIRPDNSDFVAVEREVGIRRLMEHLQLRGYRKVAYLYPWINLQPVDVRYGVYESICAEYGQEPHRIFLEVSEPRDNLRLITQAGLREAGLETGMVLAQLPKTERPDAVICHNDLVAIGLCTGLARGGVRVPEDMAVAGFDGIDEGRLLYKPLTTVVSPVNDLVREALQILTERLSEGAERSGEPRQIILPSELRVGGTT